jgi:hypothetical protein
MTLEEFKAETDRVYAEYTAKVIEASQLFSTAVDGLAEKAEMLPAGSQELVPSILRLREKQMEAEIMKATQ